MKKLLFAILTILLLVLFPDVYAYHCDNTSSLCYFDSGDSLKNVAKIGTLYVGNNSNYSATHNTWSEKMLDIGFAIESDLPYGSNGIGYQYFNFIVEYCANGQKPDFRVWNSYNNQVDYTYRTGTHMYLANGDWSYSSCYRSFIKMNLKYSKSMPATYDTYIEEGTNDFAMMGLDTFDLLYRYTDLIYLNDNDYNALLLQAKNGASNDEINSKLSGIQNKIDSVGGKVDGVKDSVDDLNDSINNSDTTQANSSGSSFFSNFRVDSTRGFSSIITAPIRLIQGILDGSSSCSPLAFDVSLKHNSTTQSNEVSLPCGSILWNNVPNTAVLLYWSTIFGLFAWWVLRDMYKFIDGIRDPDDKTEFLMNL